MTGVVGLDDGDGESDRGELALGEPVDVPSFDERAPHATLLTPKRSTTMTVCVRFIIGPQNDSAFQPREARPSVGCKR